ncbi:hypothetical protein BZ05_04345, partial [Escherichia coli O111:NM str. K6915]|uniref:hypothetical protein n=4 Tax=Escherichia coli TaxID=562 RepID=UPI00044A754E
QLTPDTEHSRYARKRPLVLTVPRALSRIHRITKFTLKRAAEQPRSKTDTAKRHQKIDNRGRCSGVVT